MKEWLQITMIVFAFVVSIAGFFIALRIEQVAGYYECSKCGHKHVPTYLQVLFAPHFGRTRLMKCPKCGKHTYQKKVVSKSEKNSKISAKP
jgi:predicted nucleic-acid-binding Zn-ribbon protein